MKRRVLILGLILLFQHLAFAVQSYNTGRRYHPPRHYYNHPRYYHNRPYRINALRGGTLTGFSPPVTGSYYASSGNTGVGANIRRFFDQRFNNHYVNSPYYNPYSNGIYTNNSSTTLFSTPNPNYDVYYNDQNEFDLNGDNGFKTETKVTIID